MFSIVDKTIFSEWLIGVMEQKKMTQADLHRSSGLSRTSISNYYNGYRAPDRDAIFAIAKGLDINPNVVMQAAGLLPETQEVGNFDDWKYLLEQLPEEDRDELYEIGKLRLDRLRKKEG